MRTAALTLFCFAVLGYTAMSQKFSLLPQVGFENSKTNISYSDLRNFSPLGVKFSPQASLRLNYASKQGHGFFVGVASSRSIVSFTFTDPEQGMQDFVATASNMQLRFEGGYQFSTKPLSLNKTRTPASAQKKTSAAKKKCGSYSGRSGCQKKYSSANSARHVKKPSPGQGGSSWVKIQPSVGLGFIPAVKTDVVTTTKGGQTSYEYRAGNWSTALMAGAGFEFGRKGTPLFTVAVNYFKGLGNLGEQTITTEAGAKTITTNLQSSASGWNVRVGIPFSLNPKSQAVKQKKSNHHQRSGCGQYRIIYRCRSSN